MRQVLFHKDFISHYEDSPIADVLGDFDEWMRSSGYYDPYARRHLGYVRRALERAAPLPDDRRFDANDIDRMFRSRVRPRSFAASRWAFERYLRARGRWISVEPIGPHQALIDVYVRFMRDLQGLAPSTIEQSVWCARSWRCAARRRGHRRN